jgi:hypothetical protein
VNALVSVGARAAARVGNGSDKAVLALRDAPRIMKEALAPRRGRRVLGIAASAILALYLLAIGDIAISPSGRWAGVTSVRFAPDLLFRTRAPWLFEPVLELHPGAHVAVFASPINLVLGGIVAVLAGLNIALAAHAARQAADCRNPGYSRSLAVLPAFLLGFACCVPTFVLALGAGTAAAILPVLLPIRSLFYPVTVILLFGALVWGVHRIR